MSVGAYDLVVLAVLAVGFFHGRSKGFAWQLSGIATLALGYLAATAAAAVLFPLFPDAWPLDVKKFAAWLVTYAVVCAAIYFLTLRLSKKLKEHELEELDRRFGGALGAFKAALLLAVVSLAAIATSEQARTLVKGSSSGQLLARAAYAARPLLPDKIGDSVGKVAGKIAPEPEPTPLPPARPTPPLKPVAQPQPRATPKRPLPGTTHGLEPAPPPAPPVVEEKPAQPEPSDEDHEGAMDDPLPPEPRDPLAPPPR